ncbi:MAG: C25 family cysteine peptidase [Acidobacteriota bacterium]
MWTLLAVPRRFICTIALLAFAFLASSVQGQTVIRTYDNTTTGTIPFTSATVDDNPTVNCPPGPALTRTFTVADTFTLAGVALGLRYTHTFREDVVAVLESPAGTRATVLNNTAADPDDNLDVLFAPNAEVTAVDDGDGDNTGAPFYHREVDANGLAAFAGESSNGTWTLYLCDDFAADDGTFLSSRLVLQESTTQPTACSTTTTYDWGTNGDIAAFTSATFSDITLTETSATDYFGYAIADRAFVTRTSSQGGHAGYYGFGFDVGAAVAPDTNGDESGGQVAVFTFDPPIRDLTFDLLDVDFLTGANDGDGGFEDLVRIRPRDANGDLIPYQTQDADAGTDPDLVGEIWEGDVTAAPTATTNNPRFFIAGPLSELTLEYFSGDFPNFAADQFIGIADFVLCAYDFGDAPASYTTALAGGARHVLGDRELYLGATPPDGEGDGQPVAAGTDNNGANGDGLDEDGVAAFPPASTADGVYIVPVTATNNSGAAANLCGWFDSGQDGAFDSDEAVCVTVPAAGSNAACTDTGGGVFNCLLTFTVPVADRANSGDFYFRFRVTTDSLGTGEPTGRKDDGEVEDYRVTISSLPVTLAAFASDRGGTLTTFEWQTETETGNVGFHLYDENGNRLDPALIPAAGLDRLEPTLYRFETSAPVSDWVFLAEVGHTGKESWFGPFEIGQSYGEKVHPRPIDWAAVRSGAENAVRAGSRKASEKRAELRLSETGIYRVTFEDLHRAGVDLSGVPASDLAVWSARDGAVPRRVDGGSSFGPGSSIVFWGEAIDDSLYTDTNVYFVGQEPRRARVLPRLRGVPHPRRPTEEASERVAIERQRQYSFASPNGDPWFETALLARRAPAEATFELPVDSLVPNRRATLEVDLWGVTDWPGDALDHHLVLSFNGEVVAEDRFDGLRARRYEIPLSPGSVREGANLLTVALPGDTGFDFDLIHIDGYALRYRRNLRARQDLLRLESAPDSAGEALAVSGFSSPDIEVFTWQDGELAQLVGVRIEAALDGHRVVFGNSRGSRQEFLAISPRTFKTPAVTAARSAVDDLLTGRADWIAIAHPAFLADPAGTGLNDLLAARQGEGLDTKVVDVFDLYQEYTGGVVDPAAIERYLTEAVPALGVRYVLLIGGDTYDYLDHLGLGSLSFIPTPYRRTDALVTFAPVDSVYGDLDGDGVPEIPVGRLPVRSEEELATVLAKTLAYPQTPAGALLAADSEPSGAFADATDRTAGRLPTDWPTERVLLDDQAVGEARTRLLDGLDAGPALVTYIGHSGPTAWTFDGLFRAADLDHLENQWPMVVAQWGCWNTYHVAPRFDTLGHRFLLAGGQGAAAVLGAATLTESGVERDLAPFLVEQLFQKPGRTVGEALILAKRELAARRPGQADILLGWTLLGDPALSVGDR